MLSLLANAQDLSTEVVVDHTVVAALPAVTPLGSLQPVLSLSTSMPSPLEATEYTLPTNFNASVGNANSPLFSGLATPDNYKGYVSLGYFPAYRLGIAAGYKLLDTNADILRAAATFSGASWHTPSLGDNKFTLKSNNINIGATYAHTFSQGTVATLEATYAHTGLSQIVDAFSNSDNTRPVNRARIDIDVKRNVLLSWAAKAYFSTFSIGDIGTWKSPQTINGASEKLFGISARVSGNDNSRFFTAVSADFRNSTSPVIAQGGFLSYRTEATEGIIGINPAYDLTLAGIDVRLGVRADFGINCGESSLRITPDIAATWHPSRRAAVYARFSGGKAFNTLAEQFAYSPWAPNMAIAPAKFTPIDAVAGLRLGSFEGVTADIHAGYAATRNALRPAFADQIGFPAIMTPVRVSGWKAGIDIRYRGTLPVEAHFAADAYASGADSGFDYIPDAAKATIDAAILCHIRADIDLSIKYKLRACRSYVYETSYGRSMVDLGNIADLGIRADWKFDERISTFLIVDNLLCRRHFVMPDIASPRLNGLIGATLRF